MHESALLTFIFFICPSSFVCYILGMCVIQCVVTAPVLPACSHEAAALGSPVSGTSCFNGDLQHANMFSIGKLTQPCVSAKTLPVGKLAVQKSPMANYILGGAFQASGITYFPIYIMPCHENVMQCIQCHEVSVTYSVILWPVLTC